MRRFEPKDLQLLQQQFDRHTGSIWQECYIEYHGHYDEVPVFILLFAEYDLQMIGQVCADIAEWYQERYDWPSLTIGFQLLDDEMKYIVAYEEGPYLSRRLRNLRPFEDISGEPKSEGVVFKSKKSLRP
jgi:hypothetical protein